MLNAQYSTVASAKLVAAKKFSRTVAAPQIRRGGQATRDVMTASDLQLNPTEVRPLRE